MTTAADRFDDTPSPTDQQQFVHLANNLVELLGQRPVSSSATARRRRRRWPRRHLSCNRKSSAIRALRAPDPAH